VRPNTLVRFFTRTDEVPLKTRPGGWVARPGTRGRVERLKRRWTEEELIERWTLSPDEVSLLSNKTGATRVGFAVLLRFFAGEGRFPRDKTEVVGQVVAYLARQAGVPAEEYLRYDWQGRTVKYHRAQVREHFGFREATAEDADGIRHWLLEEVLPHDRDPERLREAVYPRYWLRTPTDDDPGVPRILTPPELKRYLEGTSEDALQRLPRECVVEVG